MPQTSVVLTTRPYLIEEYTQTVCPHCFAKRRWSSDEDVWRGGMLVSHDDKVWMKRFCAAHGESESLYEEDLEIWRARNGWSVPTSQITPDNPKNFAPFPHGYRDGLPASHGQHTCILLLNVTQRCNLSCPTCYASAKFPGTPIPIIEHPTIEELRHTVGIMLAREGGKLGVLMLSGGEPTVREDIAEIIEAALEFEGITRVLINTNGKRIARDDRFLEFLRKHRDRVEIYLQFDGLSEASNIRHRGEDLRAEKRRAIERLQSAGVWMTLVMAVSRENQHEVGEVAQLGLSTPKCSGMAIQPIFGSGRNSGFDASDRTTPTGVLRRLEAQTGGLISHRDFIPLPCSHKDCCDISYLLQNKKGEWQSLPQLIGRDDLKNWIGLVSNTISFENASQSVAQMLKSGALARVFSEQQKVSTTKLASDIARMCGCVAGLPEILGAVWNQEKTLEKMAEKTFRITVKQFMDAHTFHEARIRQCCVHSGTFEEQPKRFSFCWRYLFDESDFGA